MKNVYKPQTCPEGWVRADPLPSPAELKQYYTEKYYQEAGDCTSTYQEDYSDVEIKHKHFEAELCLFALSQKLKNDLNKSSVIEIGVGEGFFLKALKENVENCKGVDFSAFGVEKFFPELLPNFEQADIYEYLKKDHNKYDAIVMRNVIEHVPDPKELLESMKSKVKDDGLIAFSFPNDYSLIQKLSIEMKYTEKEFWFYPPDHLYYFNTKNIFNLLEPLEFEVLDLFSIFPVDLFLLHPGSNYVDKPDLGKYAHKARIQMELNLWKNDKLDTLNLFRQFAKNGIGREITVILKKKS